MAVVCLFFLLQFVPVLLGYAQESISLPEMEWDGHLGRIPIFPVLKKSIF